MSRARNFLMALAAALLAPIAASAVEPSKITPELIAAARKEGKVVVYTSIELQMAEKVAKHFEAAYPGIKVQVERSGSERLFQRLGQEYGSNIRVADVITTSDAAHFVIWKRQGWLAPYLPEDVVLHFPKEQYDPDGTYASWRLSLSVMGYNTKLIKAEDAPKGYRDLLDPKWAGRMVKANPNYSGTALTGVFQISRELGWEFFEKLAGQRVMQVQSSTEPPKKLSLGERAIQVDGNEYVLLQVKREGNPVEIIYAREGTPVIISPSAVLKAAPNPNAARLYQSHMFSRAGQQMLIDSAGMRSYHRQTKVAPDLPALDAIKVLKDDAAAVADEAEKIKERHSRYFRT
ncbi:MAG: extracellular solute-binding protein [Alphaproteobacteria bacterium]|nr:extracellular solute-binding protein [Alphaproteobacteria bacterium]